ncbi:MAG: anti-sigma factor [Polyangiaceae bacterium]
MDGEREIAGRTCSDVLAKLDALLDGTLDAAEREIVLAHVQGCDRCAKFGSAYAAVTKGIRALTAEGPLPESDVLERLRARLNRAIDG